MMTCKEVLESLSSFVDADLKQEIVIEMERHIDKCSDCRAEFDSLTMTLRLYKHVDQPPMPRDCHERLVKVLQIEKMKATRGDGAAPDEPTEV
jgi:predicted anti-sigma-YlaC factor YlaD